MRSKVKVVLVIVLMPALIALVVVEYQHFEQEALRWRLIDTALAHTEVLVVRQQHPEIFQRAPGITGSTTEWLMVWSEGTTPGWHLYVSLDKGTEQVTEVSLQGF